MHEVSIAEALIEQVGKELRKSGHPMASEGGTAEDGTIQGGTVVGLDLIVGRLSGVHVDSLRFAFDFVSRETIVEGAELRIEETRASSVCRACGAREEIDDIVARCAKCMSHEITIEGGRELTLQSIEIEEAA